MRSATHFFAPPAGSDSGLRPPQGQSRCKNGQQLSLNNAHKLAKQITPLKPYLNIISFLILIDSHLFFTEIDCAHLPLERKKKLKGINYTRPFSLFPYGIYLFLSFYYDESVRLGYDFFATLALRSP